MKRIFLIFAILILISAIAFSAGTRKTLAPDNTFGKRHVVQSFTNTTVAGIDTLVFTRDEKCIGLTVGIYFQDSASVDLVTLRRVFVDANYSITSNGAPGIVSQQTASIDTLAIWTAYTNLTNVANPTSYRIATITQAPYPVQYWIIIDHASAGAGTTTSKPYVVEINQQF